MSECEIESIYRSYCEEYYREKTCNLDAAEFRNYASQNWEIGRVLDYALRRLNVDEPKLQRFTREEKIGFIVSLMRKHSSSRFEGVSTAEFRSHVLDSWEPEQVLDYALLQWSRLNATELAGLSLESKTIYTASLLHDHPGLLRERQRNEDRRKERRELEGGLTGFG
jgi:hypothetical protein